MSEIRKLVAAGVFGYAAGKSLIAQPLAALFPTHDTYVEPFCGSAALFFTKSPSRVEVLADINADVVGAFKAMQSLSPAELEELQKRDWLGSRVTFEKLRDSAPSTRVDQLHRFLYVNRFSFGKNRKTFSPALEGSTSGVHKRVALLAPRLKKAIIRTADYASVMKEFDGKDTFFFLDPPYPGSNSASGVGEKTFDETKFRKVLDGVRGRFLLTYGVHGNLDTSGFNVKRMRQARQVGRMNGPERRTSDILTHLVVTNFDLTAKSIDGLEFDDVIGTVETSDEGSRFMVSSRASISVGGLPRARAYKHEDILHEYPSDAGPIPAEMQLRFRDGSVEADLVFKVNDETVGWTMAVQRAAPVGEPVEVAKSFSAEGSRFFEALTAGVRAREVTDEIATAVYSVDKFEIEMGLQTEDAHEYFLSKGRELWGVLKVERGAEADASDDVARDHSKTVFDLHPWLVTLMPEWPMPQVAKSVDAPMPPDGISALPQSLERVVPPELRYWEHRGADAKRVRDALVVLKLFTPGSVVAVDGEARLVALQPALYEPREVEAPAGVEWPLARVAGLLPAGAQVVEHFTPDEGAIAKCEAIVYCDAGEGAGLEVVAKALAARTGDYIVTALDSARAREQLGQLGRVFKFRPGRGVGADALDRIFAASFGVRSSEVEWIGKADLTTGDLVGGGLLMPAMSGGRAPSAAEHRRRRRRQKADVIVDDLFEGTREIKLAKAADTEERFVLGIVLEPDTVDAQNDVYSAEEVRSAAHKFMERFQNIGHMHKDLINSKAKILESYLAPIDFTVGDQKVKKGTWVMATRVSDDKLWKTVKAGDLTGYSIGGSAKRVKEPSP
jgi:site-specific DNA-adenine methylase